MGVASFAGRRAARWLGGLAVVASSVSASAEAGGRPKSASVREVKVDARMRRAVLRDADVRDAKGVEVREFRYLGPTMQFLAEVEVGRGGKVEERYDTATIGSGSWKEQTLILIVEPPKGPGKKARINLRAVAEYGIPHVLAVGSTGANHQDIPPLWFGWEHPLVFETPDLTPAVLTKGKALTLMEWKVIESPRPAGVAPPGTEPEPPRRATLTVRAKPLFW